MSVLRRGTHLRINGTQAGSHGKKSENKPRRSIRKRPVVALAKNGLANTAPAGRHNWRHLVWTLPIEVSGR